MLRKGAQLRRAGERCRCRTATKATTCCERLGPENVFTADFLAGVDRWPPLRRNARDVQRRRAGAKPDQPHAGLDLKFTLADNDLPEGDTARATWPASTSRSRCSDERWSSSRSRLAAAADKLRGTRCAISSRRRCAISCRRDHREEEARLRSAGRRLAADPARRLARACRRQPCGSLRTRDIVRADFIDGCSPSTLAEHPGTTATMVWILMMLELWFQRAEADRR